MKAEGDGLLRQSPRHRTPACPVPSAKILWRAPATPTSPAAMVLLSEYAPLVIPQRTFIYLPLSTAQTRHIRTRAEQRAREREIVAVRKKAARPGLTLVASPA
jgi:hypothetical protein